MTDSEIEKILTDAISYTEQIKQSFNLRFGEENVEVKIPMPLNDPKHFVQWYRNKQYLEGTIEPLVDPITKYCGSNILIMVHWADVKIVNVNITPEISHMMKDLYSKVTITGDGRLHEWTMNRSTYTLSEWNSDYIHSHLPRRDRLPKFNHPCTGGGPIGRVMSRLKNEPFDIDWWDTFTFELSRYVGVESTEGGPYIRITSITPVDAPSGRSSSSEGVRLDPRSTYDRYRSSSTSLSRRLFFAPFLQYLLRNYKIPFVCTGGAYIVDMDIKEFWLFVSSAFIDWYNISFTVESAPYTEEELIELKHFFVRAAFKDGEFYEMRRIEHHSNPLDSFTGDKTCCIFKGKRVPFKITELGPEDESLKNTVLLIEPFIINKLYKSLNSYMTIFYGYKPKTTKTRR